MEKNETTLTIRVSVELKTELHTYLEKEGKILNTFCARAIARALKEENK
jgi:hypothetical protein